MQRRTLLKVSAAGVVALLAAGGGWYALKDRRPPPASPADVNALLTAVTPALLGPALPATPMALDRSLTATRNAIAALPEATRKELDELFALLSIAPARFALTGLPNWQQASVGAVIQALESWRVDSMPMLQTAYHTLHDLIIGAWYADESMWDNIGYPDPAAVMAAKKPAT